MMSISKISTRLLGVAAVLSMVSVGAAKAATEISECGKITEPGSYVVVNDLPGSKGLRANGSCIVIQTRDVTLDLGGHQLRGNGVGDTVRGDGIYMRNRVNITILNGTVRGFVDDGIADNFSGTGRNHRIVNVRAINNGGYGILLNGSGFSVTGCIAEGNGLGGILVGKNSTVTGNRANNNGSAGIFAGAGSLTKGNSANGNTGNGILALSSGSVIGNTANDNGDLGINLSGTSFLVEGNSASGNTSGGITNCGSCVYGVNFGVIP